MRSHQGFAIHPTTANSLCQPSSKWIPFSNQGRIRQRKERDGLRLSSTVPQIQWVCNPHCPPPLRPLGYGKPLSLFKSEVNRTLTDLSLVMHKVDFNIFAISAYMLPFQFVASCSLSRAFINAIRFPRVPSLSVRTAMALLRLRKSILFCESRFICGPS